MLTRKQAWRHVRSRRSLSFEELPDDAVRRRLAPSATSATTGLSEMGGARCERSHSWPKPGKGFGLPTALPNDSPPRGRGKRVTFNRSVSVLLVPSRKDYDQVTKRAVWFMVQEICCFRQNAFEFWKRHGSLSLLSAEELAEAAPESAMPATTAAATGEPAASTTTAAPLHSVTRESCCALPLPCGPLATVPAARDGAIVRESSEGTPLGRQQLAVECVGASAVAVPVIAAG